MAVSERAWRDLKRRNHNYHARIGIAEDVWGAAPHHPHNNGRCTPERCPIACVPECTLLNSGQKIQVGRYYQIDTDSDHLAVGKCSKIHRIECSTFGVLYEIDLSLRYGGTYFEPWYRIPDSEIVSVSEVRDLKKIREIKYGQRT